MNNKEGKEKSVIKTLISNSLKVQFKLFCVQNEITMSEMLERLIRNLIEADQDLLENLNPPLQNPKVVKGYIPSSLKLQFKVFCTQKQLPMNLVLSYLIETWVEINNQ